MDTSRLAPVTEAHALEVTHGLVRHFGPLSFSGLEKALSDRMRDWGELPIFHYKAAHLTVLWQRLIREGILEPLPTHIM
jgi:hypothetical protein